MDGLESRRSVFVIAATNRPELIDPAMMRPYVYYQFLLSFVNGRIVSCIIGTLKFSFPVCLSVSVVVDLTNFCMSHCPRPMIGRLF